MIQILSREPRSTASLQSLAQIDWMFFPAKILSYMYSTTCISNISL